MFVCITNRTIRNPSRENALREQHTTEVTHILCRYPAHGTAIAYTKALQTYIMIAVSESNCFSLLMSVYSGDSLTNLRRAVGSNTVEQTLPPTQVVIVRDGPVPTDIQLYLDSLPKTVQSAFVQRRPGISVPEIRVIPLQQNRGLAHALNVGLAHCTCELVARADSDDISLPSRFAALIPLFKSGLGKTPDVVGSAIQEFEGTESKLGQIRVLPEGGPELLRYARMRSPLHHPSVMFRKSVVLAAGGYPENIGRFEDYLLWERLILNGAILYNVPTPLVLYRVDSGAYRRRGGWTMFREELRLQQQFRRDGFITGPQFLRNVGVRAIYRLVPTKIRRTAYHALTALRNHGLPIS